MGQYYIPILISEDGSIRTLYSHEYDNGLKLMEHSYIGNDFVNAVLTEIWRSPARVAWIGDYSDDVCGDLYEKKLPREDFMRYYAAAWCKGREALRIHPEPRNILTMRIKRRYLMNHTQKIYIHIGEYIAANRWTEQGAWKNGRYDPFATYDMCINPLPLLTACGNNRGGGDYRSGHPGFDQVGSWAFDLIECTDRLPETDYKKVDCRFSEQCQTKTVVV